MVDTVVIGAGPYGLSVAAHIRHRQVSMRVFGKPMGMWRDHMPKGLTLKSDAFASNIAAPGNDFTMQRFYEESGRPDYSHLGLRVRGDTVAEYGQEFQRRYVGDVEDVRVEAIDRTRDGFRLSLDTGEQVSAQKVIVATGLRSLREMPESLASLPPTMVSHSSDHNDLAAFKGRRVIVVGGGQSACELSALLNEQGAKVTMVTRRPLVWYEPENEDKPNVQRNAWQQIRRPNFGLGPGWRTWFWSERPYQFSYLPLQMRYAKAYGLFAPAGSGWIKHRVDGVIPLHTGQTHSVQARENEARLSVRTNEGLVELVADHVIAATGYRPEISRIPFLERVQDDIQTIKGAPILNRSFESSLPGMYFAGFMSAATFGPSMRFIYGARFAADRISRHLAHLGHVKPHAGRMAVGRPEPVEASA